METKNGIRETLDFIESRSPSGILLFPHASAKAKMRSIDIEELRNKLLTGKKLGIVQQSEFVFKLLIMHNTNIDLNVILRTTKDNVYIITAFLSDADDRKKNEKTR